MFGTTGRRPVVPLSFLRQYRTLPELLIFGTDVWEGVARYYRAHAVLPCGRYYRAHTVVLQAGSLLPELEGKVLAGTTGLRPVLPG